MEHYYNPKIFLHAHCSQFHPNLPGSGDSWSIFCPYSFAFSRMSYNWIIKYVTIYVWFLSLIMMLLRFICVVGCISSSFLFVTYIPVGVPHFVYLFIVIHEFVLVAFITSKKMLVITSSILSLFLPHYFSPLFLELQLNICLPLFLSPCILYLLALCYRRFLYLVEVLEFYLLRKFWPKTTNYIL